MTEQDVVEAFWGDKWRPAILLDLTGEFALVACLTSKYHAREAPQQRISRRHERRWFNSLRLTRTSYLYRQNVLPVLRSEVRPSLYGGRCPADLFELIQREFRPWEA